MTAEPTGRCFAPVVDEGTRILILGSLPGQRSLAAQRYYAHPQNQFWRLVGAVIGMDLLTLGYAERLASLLQARIGLWDTVAEARRAGSLDSAIRDAAPNDLGALVARLPQLRLIAYNGQKAASVGRRQLLPLPDLRCAVLPSSSPAHTIPFEQKLAAWRTALLPDL